MAPQLRTDGRTKDGRHLMIAIIGHYTVSVDTIGLGSCGSSNISVDTENDYIIVVSIINFDS